MRCRLSIVCSGDLTKWLKNHPPDVLTRICIIRPTCPTPIGNGQTQVGSILYPIISIGDNGGPDLQSNAQWRNGL